MNGLPLRSLTPDADAVRLTSGLYGMVALKIIYVTM